MSATLKKVAMSESSAGYGSFTAGESITLHIDVANNFGEALTESERVAAGCAVPGPVPLAVTRGPAVAETAGPEAPPHDSCPNGRTLCLGPRHGQASTSPWSLLL